MKEDNTRPWDSLTLGHSPKRRRSNYDLITLVLGKDAVKGHFHFVCCVAGPAAKDKMASAYRLLTVVALLLLSFYGPETQARFLIGKRPSSRGFEGGPIFGFVSDGSSQYGSISGSPQDSYNSLISLRGRYGK
uniref:Transmembrane protein n=2 Tax=Steinernema glaseri TaxID=37863 RepID=A0A1I8AGG4_9BILA